MPPSPFNEERHSGVDGGPAMAEPLYVPVLPTRRDAWNAYAHLELGVRQRIAPLWTVVPRVGPERPRGTPLAPDPDNDREGLHHWLTLRLDHVINVMAGLTGWVDTAHVESLLDASAPSLWRLTTGSSLRLVTGPERDPALQRYAADLAFLSGRGLGIRVLLDDAPDEPLSTRLLTLIDRLRLPPSRLDLLLDAGSAEDGDDTGKRALAALGLLAALVPWRTVVLTSGAFPRAPRHLDAQPAQVLRRHDWHLRRSVREARPDALNSVVYGDYSVEHVCSANIASVQRPGPPWGLLRYTTPDSFLIARAPTRGRDRASRVRAMARWITENDAFRDAGAISACVGEGWLHACAYGDGRDGSGNAETWIRVGHTQHMNFIVQQLARTA
ncbi:beta family protein [Streptomyces caniferus]|uniref:beta family protein n=1 Tax=Streptomyces caniferus TaxID=285557 RepID=UPI002E280BE6|nr:hypothetical protein [Streptomyces caniferus]